MGAVGIVGGVRPGPKMPQVVFERLRTVTWYMTGWPAAKEWRAMDAVSKTFGARQFR